MKYFVLSYVLIVSAVACNKRDAGDWAIVSQEPLVSGVEITGSLKATESISIGPPPIQSMWEFKIAALAPEGEVAKEGDMLVTFDTSDLAERRVERMNDKESAQVALEKKQVEIKLATQDDALKLVEAEAAVRKASIGADQSEELTGSLAIAKAKIDLASAKENAQHLRAQMERKKSSNRGALANLRGQLELATRQVERLDKEIASATVLAPSGGTVIYGSNWNGEYKVGDTIWRLGSVLEVATLDQMMADGIVDEADSAKLTLGQKIHLRLESQPDQEITGVLTEIAKTMHQKSRTVPTRVVSVKLSIEAPKDLKLRPGMRFRGDVETERIEQAVVVPLAAVFPSPSGPIAYVKTGDEVRRRKLVLGLRGKRGVEVLEGLAPGDRVSRVDFAHKSPAGGAL